MAEALVYEKYNSRPGIMIKAKRSYKISNIGADDLASSEYSGKMKK